MKLVACGFIMFAFVSYSGVKENTYTASTPADAVVKTFLGILMSDSVDYIQWKIMLREKDYSVSCNYQILNNKTGVLQENRKVELKGMLTQDKKYYILHHKDKMLKLAKLNADLLHIVHTDNSLLIGNGGWSYTINNKQPLSAQEISFKAKPTVVKDSMVFIGRSPCGVPGIITKPNPCYKLKWKITFYGNSRKNEPTTCLVSATPYRDEGIKPGTWKIISDNNGRIFYHLYDTKGKPYLYLEKADENILLFTDANGKLLTGDQDYSFTLNRRA